MCLVFQYRKATKDVDGIFEPTKEIREAACKVAQKNQVPLDWLNNAAKGFFFKDPPKQNVMELSNLRVWAPTAEYMLAMKAISARFDTHDKEDLIFLIQYLNLSSSKEIYSILEKYMPRKQIPAKTGFLIEELFDTCN